MAESIMTSLLLNSYRHDDTTENVTPEEQQPELPVSPTKTLPVSLTKTPPRRSTTHGRYVATLTTHGDYPAIEIQNKHLPYIDEDEETLSATKWLTLEAALPSPDEAAIVAELKTLVLDFWPTVPIDSFKLRLVKSSWDDDSIYEFTSDDDGEVATEAKQIRGCQARMGVFEGTQEDNGAAIYGDILIGPKMLYNEKNAKRPEFEHETRALREMVCGLRGYLLLLTPRAKKRVAEDTYNGSTSPVKRMRTTGAEADNATVID